MSIQSETVLEVKNISKIYSRKEKSTRHRLATSFIRELMGRSYKLSKKLKEGEFWSLRNINFTLKRGKALGIIGQNGAGKTTLLRILAGQILPDRGEIRYLGNITAMIDLTAGFQMSQSGHNNIYLRGAMLGFSEKYIKTIYDEILNFSELGDAINAPVSSYSSGMLMRLAFSIMVTTKPDILLIDEILSVGDFVFRQKCLGKIREMREYSSFIFVSHSMENIRLFCDDAIVLKKGKMIFIGDPKEAIKVYEESAINNLENNYPKNNYPKNNNPKNNNPKRSIKVKIKNFDKGPAIYNKELIKMVEYYWCDKNGNSIDTIKGNQTLYFKLIFVAKYKIKKLRIGIPIWNEEGVYVTAFSTETQEDVFQIIPNKKTEFFLEVPSLKFNPGIYYSNCAITDGLEFIYRESNKALEVTSDNNKYWGIVSVPHYWNKTN